jgi:hypothetical protein
MDSDDADDDDDDIRRRPRRAEKRPAESLLQQQPRRVRSRLRFVSESNNFKNNILTRKTMEDSPSPALNGSSQGVSSQAAQLHSGHLRVHSSHLSPYEAEGGERTLPAHSRRSVVNLDFPASDIGVPVALSAKSNSLHGEERIVFENAANMVRYHTWFVNPFVKPAENDTLLESYWVKAATKLGWGTIEMGKSAMTFVSLLIDKITSRVRLRAAN